MNCPICGGQGYMGLVTFECHTEGCQNCGLIVVPKQSTVEPEVGRRVFLRGKRDMIWTVTRHNRDVFWSTTPSQNGEFWTPLDEKWEYADEHP